MTVTATASGKAKPRKRLRSPLEDAILDRAGEIVHLLHRPFTFKDFVPEFEVNGATHSITPKTFRNKMSEMVRNGDMVVYYKSSLTFYTVPGSEHSLNPVTQYHTGVNRDLLEMVSRIPMKERSLHDIHIAFSIPGIWERLRVAAPSLPMNSVSKDISVAKYQFRNCEVRLTVHSTGTVSVIVGCSSSPIPLTPLGMIEFTEILTRVEERFRYRLGGREGIDDGGDMSSRIGDRPPQAIPPYGQWLVTMWHFGVDSVTESTGKRYQETWEVARNTFLRLYSKEFPDGKRRHRVEVEESPRTAVQDVLSRVLGRPDLGGGTNTSQS